MTKFIAAPLVGLALAAPDAVPAQRRGHRHPLQQNPVVIRRGRRRHRSTASTVSLNDSPDQEAAAVSRNRSTSQAENNVSSRVLTTVECRSWISNHDEGRLGYQTGRGPRAVAVSYAVTDEQVVCRLPEYNEICQYAPGRQITMRVSALTADTFTEVVVAGIGHLAENQEGIAETIDLPEQWPTGVSTHLVCLDLADLEGSTWCAEAA